MHRQLLPNLRQSLQSNSIRVPALDPTTGEMVLVLTQAAGARRHKDAHRCGNQAVLGPERTDLRLERQQLLCHRNEIGDAA